MTSSECHEEVQSLRLRSLMPRSGEGYGSALRYLANSGILEKVARADGIGPILDFYNEFKRKETGR